MASSAALTTTHLPRLRAQLEEWQQKQRAPTPFKTLLSDITARALQDSGGVRGKDVTVAFRTRPPLPDEAEEKFQAYESKDEPTAAPPDVQSQEGEGVPATEPVKVEFCAGVTVTDAEPGTFVAHVPGYKASIFASFSEIMITQSSLAFVLVVWTDFDTQGLWFRSRLWPRGGQ